MLFDDFKKAYPDKWKKGTSYESYDFMSIIIMIPDDGVYKYEYFSKKLTLIRPYLTKRQAKALDELERNQAMVDISEIMKEKRINQKHLSEISGVSRPSINNYLSGNKTPKLSTINKMRNALEENGYI